MICGYQNEQCNSKALNVGDWLMAVLPTEVAEDLGRMLRLGESDICRLSKLKYLKSEVEARKESKKSR